MLNENKLVLHIIIAMSAFSAILCDIQPPVINPSILTPSKSLGECQACRIFIESFKNGLERTSRGQYEGGDAAWEEEKLKKSYKRSEMRLIDIQDGICKESKQAIHCHHMAEKAEEYIEAWWSQNPDESEDLYIYICIEKLKVCCPKFHYGKDCAPCRGDHEKLCSGNGKCRGDGTRKGNGTCLCDIGYAGDECNQCSSGYYLSHKDDSQIVCSLCHKACMGGCRDGTHKDCVACKPGYIQDSEEGCKDVNECDEPYKCAKNQFCLNSIGSFICMNCDRSCYGCHGDGPDMCKQCAKGYAKNQGLCIVERNDEDLNQDLTSTRGEEL
ncbi:cysteine-rich with EGF-like domain protein 2 isoform X2 [Achroia grisella]|uniref:cysteine-rich with EGF-like domain protein 2 isoform X2 n=1 Tax=Achroia grisella TaxID=688607 RepID=UPI0027D30054|nr:cysteine-rich with EGF-like domain protein 2 isoform X2 [Achroia grisella]